MKSGEQAQAQARKLLRRLTLALVGLAAVVLVALWATLTWLSTPAGERRLREEVLSAVNGAIVGRLAVGGLELRGPGDLVLTDVALFDPEGRLVARVERLEARADLLQLAAKRVHLSTVALRGGELLLVQDPGGLNLVRAVQARHPGPPDSQGAPFDWDVSVDAAAASEVHLEYRSVRDAPPVARVDELRLEGSGRYRLGGSALELELAGTLAQPMSGRLSLAASAHGGSRKSPHDPLTIDRLVLAAAHSRASLTGRYEAGRLEATIGELLLARSDVRAIAPDLPLASDLQVAGRASLAADRATADLAMPHLRVEASADLSPLSAEARAQLSALDLSELIEGAPPTRLEGVVSGRFAEGEPKPGTGQLTLDLSRSLVRGVSVASTTGTVALRGRQLLPDLVVTLPGGKASVTGSLAARQLDLKALLAVGDLRAFSAALAAVAGAEAPEPPGSRYADGPRRG
ncbi:MAG: hypothetical protein QM765_53115 [Myxococcales bacterium]